MTDDASSSEERKHESSDDIEVEPWMNVPMVFGLIGLFTLPEALEEFRETYEARTKVGKVVYFIQYPFLLGLLAFTAILAATMVALGGLLALPTFAVIGYKQVVYKDEI